MSESEGDGDWRGYEVDNRREFRLVAIGTVALVAVGLLAMGLITLVTHLTGTSVPK